MQWTSRGHPPIQKTLCDHSGIGVRVIIVGLYFEIVNALEPPQKKDRVRPITWPLKNRCTFHLAFFHLAFEDSRQPFFD
jgi:hypothetical protein